MLKTLPKLGTVLLTILLMLTPVFARQNYGYRLNGDINHDCKVDIFDLSLLGKLYLSKRGDGKYRGWADLNKDGIIDDYDLFILSVNYGRSIGK